MVSERIEPENNAKTTIFDAPNKNLTVEDMNSWLSLRDLCYVPCVSNPTDLSLSNKNKKSIKNVIGS